MKKRILIAEDDLTIQELIIEFLSSQGYFVDSANDGLECINKFKENEYDLVILDAMMPNLDGFATCKIIRKSSNIPIIFLTALDNEENEIKGFELECDDYIAKPFSFNILIKRVDAILKRTCEDKSQLLSFESLHLNLNTYKAIVDNKEVDLTLTEFNLLKCIMENYPTIITRSALLDKVWGYDYYGEERIVDAHIKNIRKKIELPYIKTVKGIGYTLEKTSL